MTLILIVLLVLLLCGGGYSWNVGAPPIVSLVLTIFFILLLVQLLFGIVAYPVHWGW